MIPKTIRQFFALFLLQTVWVATTASTPGVFITLQAKAQNYILGTVTQNRFQLNWHNAKPQIGDWVGLFAHNPLVNSSNPIFKRFVTNLTEGMVTTHVSLPRLVADLPLYKQCLGYWIAYVRGETILVKSCFKTQPNWMWENRDVIGKMSLTQMMIPGTHDAGSFQEYVGILSENVITEFTVAQTHDFWDQFAFGIRFFDLRLLSDSLNKNLYWLVHGPNVINRFLEQLKIIKNFTLSSKEIIILDFHTFSGGFNSIIGTIKTKRHDYFVNLLNQELGDLIIPRDYGYNVTLNTLWEKNKRIMLCYNLGAYYKNHPNLWPGVYQAWANTDDVNKLTQYFENLMEKPINYSIWSVQAALTPGITDWLFTPNEGLREDADLLNPVITKYVRDYWWGLVNNVPTDFFLGSNLIEVSIESNRKRAQLM